MPELRLITRSADLSGLAPRVAAAFSAWQRIHDAPQDLHRQLDDEDQQRAVEDQGVPPSFTVEHVAGRRVAFLQPRTVAEAVSLLQCVFLDEAARMGWGLPVEDQLRVLGNVKRFLADYLAAQPESAL